MKHRLSTALQALRLALFLAFAGFANNATARTPWQIDADCAAHPPEPGSGGEVICKRNPDYWLRFCQNHTTGAEAARCQDHFGATATSAANVPAPRTDPAELERQRLAQALQHQLAEAQRRTTEPQSAPQTSSSNTSPSTTSTTQVAQSVPPNPDGQQTISAVEWSMMAVLVALALLAFGAVFVMLRRRRAQETRLHPRGERGGRPSEKSRFSPPSVFLSFASADKARATALLRQLESAGVNCWIAPRDVRAGYSYAEEITHAVQTAPVFCILISRASNRSESVLGEVELARRFKRITLPVFLEEVELSKALLYYLSSAQWIDYYKNPAEGIEQILEVVARPGVGVL